MEKVGEDEEKIIEETNNSEKTRSNNEDERNGVDPLETIEEGSMDPSNSNTSNFKDPDFNESDMEEEEEKVLEFFRRSSGFIHDVSERSNFSNLDKTKEHTSSETEQMNEIKSSSDTEDSTNSDELDSSLSMYYFDGSLPVSAHVQESETYQEDENKMPLLFPKRRVLQTTSWRNCCGLLEILRAAYT